MPADYWSLTFDADGNVKDPGTATLIAQITSSGVTDLYLMSHGWGNDVDDAQHLYETMFSLLLTEPGFAPSARFVGIFWPSIWFPDPTPAELTGVAAAVSAGAPGQADAAVTGQSIAASLSQSMPDAAPALTQMGNLIDTGLAQVAAGAGNEQQHTAALEQFHRLLKQVFSGPVVATEDGGEGTLINSDNPKDDYQKLAVTMGSAPPAGDVQSLGDIFGKVWNGAKDALRVGSYFQMKARAGDVGQKGLGPFLEQLHKASPTTRVHLIGHSFGARLVSFTLAGISSASASPVASLTLLQGAFSHWAFTQAADNPFKEPGALCVYPDRVHGPMVATFTDSDWAVGIWYPKASFLARQDVEGTDSAGRWDGMGKDGFQAVNPSGKVTLPLTSSPALSPGSFYQVDANAVINDTSQSAFAGAHSDILKPEVAALIIAASATQS
jgi:hypothetical protein